MTNGAIADALNMLSKLMELHGQNSFRAKSYSIAAFQIDKSSESFSTLSPESIISQKNIGTSVGNKIIELLNTGHIQSLDELLAQTPEGVLEMMKVKGLGPKKIAQLWSELNIASLSDLELAAVENRLVDVKGFGEKTQAKILESIAFMHQNAGFNLYVHALQQQAVITEYLNQQPHEITWQWAGELIRQLDVIQRLEIVAQANILQLSSWFSAWPLSKIQEEEDFVIVESDSFLPIYIYFTSTEEYAQRVFELNSAPVFLNALKKEKVSPILNNEVEWFSKNGWTYLPPVLRNTDIFISKAKAGMRFPLIEAEDVKGLIHCHSIWSDGVATIHEMANACIARGLEYMVISDHSRTAFYANGLSLERIKEQHKEIDELNKRLAPFKIFKSIESDILFDGALDYEDEVLSIFDIVIASVHGNLTMTEEKAMQRLSAAISNPFTRILGHCTGRLLLSRAGYPVNHFELIDLCAKHQVVLEINANPRRLDVDWQYIPYAIEKGVLLSINPDAHSIKGIDDIKYGIASAQKGGLEAIHNLSSFTLSEFEKFVATKKY